MASVEDEEEIKGAVAEAESEYNRALWAYDEANEKLEAAQAKLEEWISNYGS